MKKLLFLALLLAFSLFALAACSGNGNEVEENGGEVAAEETPAPDPTPEPDTGENGEVNGGEEAPAGRTRASILADLEGWPEPTGYVVLGHWTDLDPNILGGWTNPMPLAQMRGMISGLGTMGRDSGNDFFPNPMVLVNGDWPVIRDNPDGSRTYTFTIYTDNQFSDGTFVNAYHYAGGIALALSPQWLALVPGQGDFVWLEGRDPFRTGETDVLTGIRVYSESQFSVTAIADQLPQIWEAAMHQNFAPVPLHMYGVEAHDSGDGVFITALGGGELSFEALHAVVEGIEGYLTDADGNYVYGANDERMVAGDGIRYRPTVFSGPYMFEDIDVGNGVLTLRANPYYPGTWDGYKPRIERVIWRVMPQPLLIDAVAQGEAHMLTQIDDGTVLENGMEILVGGGTHTFNNFDQFGQIFMQMHTDTGPTQFRAVRQAIGFLIDRHEISEMVGRGFSTVAHGPWAPAWWWYQEAVDRGLYDRVTIYDLNLARAIEILEEDGWNYNADGSEYVHGVDTLRHRWMDEWEWGVETVPVLDEDGEETGEYHEVVQRMVFEYDDEGVRGRPIRSNKVYTGERVLMPLIINWMVREAAYAPRDYLELQLFDNLAYVGGELRQTRSAAWGGYLQGGYRSDTRYEIHVLGVGMGNPWAPWLLMSLDWIPANNWGQVDCERTRYLSERFRGMDVSTPEGREELVEGFIDYMEHLTYEAFTLPFHMSLIHDFIPHNLGNWHSNALWGFADAIVRAYWID